MVDRIKGIGDFVLNLVQTKQGTFTLGFLVSGIVGFLASFLLYTQMIDYKDDLNEYKNEYKSCQNNSMTIRLESQKECLENAKKHMEAIQAFTEVANNMNATKIQEIKQSEKKAKENEKLYKEIKEINRQKQYENN